MKVLRSKKKWVTDYESVLNAKEDLLILFDFYKEEAATEAEVDEHFQTTFGTIGSHRIPQHAIGRR